MKGSVKRFGFSVGSRSPAPPHSPLVGRVVNLEGASSSDVSSTTWRLFGLRFLRRECLVAGVSFSSTNSVVSALRLVGLTLMSWLDKDGWKVR